MIDASIRILPVAMLIFLSIAVVTAAPYSGVSMWFRQPDNSRVPVRVWGDEFYQRVETIDGYPLVRNVDGWICYAQLNADKSDWLSTTVVYNGTRIDQMKARYGQNVFLHLQPNVELRSDAIAKKRSAVQRLPKFRRREAVNIPARLAGRRKTAEHIKGITIVIDFSDSPSELSVAEISRFMNEEGYNGFGNNGSVRDYFFDVSGGLVEYSNEVIGIYRAKNSFGYYDDESVGGKTEQLMGEVLTWADSRFDFSQLTADASGRLYAVNFLYAGTPAQGWTKGLWPHMGFYQFEADGRHVVNYQISSFSDRLGLAVICHENGHLLFGWPDLYDYDHDSQGVGNYCLMSGMGDNLNPVPPNGYLRSIQGWDNVLSLNDTSGTLKLISNSNLSTYRFQNPDRAAEFFVVEARIRKGRNAALPDEGLMIWHIDEEKNNNEQQMTPEQHYRVSIVQADGMFDLEGQKDAGSPGDLFHAPDKRRFDDYTVPDARWWSGAISGFGLYEISIPSDTMTMTMKVGGDGVGITAPDSLRVTALPGKTMLEWNDNSRIEKNFRIERKQQDNEYFEIAKVEAGIERFLDESLELAAYGEFTYRVRASNDTLISVASNEATIKMPRVVQAPFHGEPILLPGIIQAEDYDVGTQGISYFDLTPGNEFGLYRDDAVEIKHSENGITSQNYCVQLEAGEWTMYSVKVFRSGKHRLQFRIRSVDDASLFLSNSEKPLIDAFKIEKSSDWKTVTYETVFYVGMSPLRLGISKGTVLVDFIEVEDLLEPTIFPNPFNGIFFINHNSISEKGYLELFDSRGKLLKTFPAGTREIEASFLLPGLYFIILFDKDNHPYQSIKFTKMR